MTSTDKEINPAELNGKGKAVALLDKPNVTTEADAISDRRVPTAEAEVVPPVDATEVTQPVVKPKKKGRKALIFAILGIGAIAGSTSGYRYWQYASTHTETDNATIAGHIHQISSRVNGTVSEVLVKNNQKVQQGQLLVKLDPRDYQVKVQQAQAALESARLQAQAAESSIALASQTTQGKTTQAQGDMGNAQAAIATAQAALTEAEAGIPAAQAGVEQAEAGVPAAQAKVRQAESAIPQAQAKVAEAEAGVSGAQAKLAQAEANLQKGQSDYNRYNALFQEGAIAREQLDTARQAYEVAVAQKSAAEQGILQAKAQVAQAKQGVTTAQAGLAEATEGVHQAEAQVAQAKVQVASAQAKVAQAQEGVTAARAKLEASRGGLQQAQASGQQTQVNRSQYNAALSAIAQSDALLKDAQLQLSYTNITAPASGQVGRKTVEIGQRVEAGTPLMAIVGNEYWVIANFKETQIANMKVGQKVEIKLDSFPNHAFEGRVESFSPASGSQFALLPPDNATGNFTKVVQRIPVKILFDDNSIKGYESRIAPGMSAVVDVELK